MKTPFRLNNILTIYEDIDVLAEMCVGAHFGLLTESKLDVLADTFTTKGIKCEVIIPPERLYKRKFLARYEVNYNGKSSIIQVSYGPINVEDTYYHNPNKYLYGYNVSSLTLPNTYETYYEEDDGKEYIQDYMFPEIQKVERTRSVENPRNKELVQFDSFVAMSQDELVSKLMTILR